MKDKSFDWILGFLLSIVIFTGVFITDAIKDINTINPLVLFILSVVEISLSIKFIKWALK